MSDNTDDTVERTLGAPEADSPTTPLGNGADPEPIAPPAAVAPDASSGPDALTGFGVGAGTGAGAGATAAPAASGPRIRWAGVIWGLAFAIVGFVALRMLLTPSGRDAVYSWTTDLTPLSIVSTVVLAIGALLLLTGLVGFAHRLQLGRRQPR